MATELTRTPARMDRSRIEALRAAGWEDRAIHDAVQMVAYFNYINRIADALGVDPEPDWATDPIPPIAYGPPATG